jgi:hypothetical protein
MPLWFEIAVLLILGVIAVCLIDLCFALESLTRNLANLGTRLEDRDKENLITWKTKR